MLAVSAACFIAWRKKADALRECEGVITAKESELNEKGSLIVSLRSDLNQELQKNTPNLQATIDATITGTLSGTVIATGEPADFGTFVLAVVTVRNRPPCAPSIAEYWVAILHKDGCESETYTPMIFPQDVVTGTMQDGRQLEFLQRDTIYDKTKPQPLPIGGSQTGYLYVLFEGRSQSDLTGCTLEVRFTDVLGKPTSATTTLMDYALAGPMHIPGITLSRPTTPAVRPTTAPKWVLSDDGQWKTRDT
ncbi:MAG: hypothetical protein QOF71_2401 [Candidatus Eremiobacteraeota bacterium]|nr:hypothetical protein [Candidatus Eremiobacteraeota bacterium]